MPMKNPFKIEKWYERTRVGFVTEGPSRTQQHMAESCDINRIMERFTETGLMDHVNRFQGDYGDFTELPEDYQGALDQVIRAEEMFLTIPAEIRSHFDNDPGRFLKAVGDPKRRQELIDIGVFKPDNPPPEGGRPDEAAPPAERAAEKEAATASSDAK